MRAHNCPLCGTVTYSDTSMLEAALARVESLSTALREIAKWNTEHDLDCEEGIGSDRCTPCLARAALDTGPEDERG